MELVVIVLNQIEYLTEILDGFMEEGLKGATVIDSAGMGHIIADHIPFFAQFADLEEDNKNNSKTIFTVVHCQQERDKAVKVVEKALGDIQKADTAFVFCVPVSFVKGITSQGCGD
ncbi:nitrogen regulatory protein P-II family [Clostridium aceticum]|uniref:Nitrogen regulatory protein P-II family n=1 Tax=Clostridium aceticum TaxID=84022 RepID=A0A0G3WG40_9CLOT|nr:hypothetical protein [Clostridium aceticum]AKL96855.1 nitrogen regulatory protein P-II family [Clostridium aceticum]